MKNRKKFANLLEIVVTERSLLIYRNAPAVIPNGIYREMYYRFLTGTVLFKLPTHTHTQAGKWDLIIAHPPCTYLTVTGNAWFDVQKYGDKARQRYKNRYKAIVFFMHFALADCDRIAIENPVCIMGSAWRSADQIIQPWMFGHPTVKKTCLWLKGLPPLTPTNIVEVDTSDVYEYVAKNGHIKHDSRNRSRCRYEDRSKHRSKTFHGIAEAMAEQWENLP